MRILEYCMQNASCNYQSKRQAIAKNVSSEERISNHCILAVTSSRLFLSRSLASLQAFANCGCNFSFSSRRSSGHDENDVTMDGARWVPRNCRSISRNGMSNNIVDPIVCFVNHRHPDGIAFKKRTLPAHQRTLIFSFYLHEFFLLSLSTTGSSFAKYDGISASM